MLLKNLEKKINYTFKNKKYLEVALIHSSYANESKKHLKNNERLEFLGDSVLSIVVSDYLFKHYAHLPEGELTKIRASLVCEKALHQFATEINLCDHIMLGKGEINSRGNKRPSILADAFEALIAAIYLDSDAQEAAKFILPFIKDVLDKKYQTVFIDYKTILQEIIQQNPEEKLEYILAEEKGPDHNKEFTVNVCLNSNNVVIGIGVGKSKKEAEQKAASEALKLMGYNNFCC